ncbi:SA1002 family membrane protein [Staphylococcus agnetis]|uniref:NADH-quinone oxidoreductase subunit J n=2 Tax=Staphylococcus TaxID=1279 RepID=A0ABX3YZ89_9STAP|nr:hypothetical protein [Staphylococcus agnetis]OSP12333.1 hypothetical protein B9L42_12495 [Staphylococcus agnetis]OSP20775.1 hypothetical protein B9M87_12355 [Staphylococcus agnetis]OTW29963.1 hypothetical protein B9M88_12485 [Staphylococcus agnetis]
MDITLKFIIIIISFVLLSVIISDRKNKFLFLNALIIFLLFSIMSYISLFLSSLLLVCIFGILNIELGNFFVLGIVIIFFAGSIQLLLFKLVLKKVNFEIKYALIIEHLIQWILIYLVIYQTTSQKILYDRESMTKLEITSFFRYFINKYFNITNLYCYMDNNIQFEDKRYII